MKRHLDAIKGPEKETQPSFEETVAKKTEPSILPESEPVIEAVSVPQTPPDPSDTFEKLFPEPTVAIAGPPSWIWWSILFVALGVLAFVGYNLTKGRLPFSPSPTSTPAVAVEPTATPSDTPTPTEEATTTPSPTPTTTPTPTPTATAIVKSSITMRVLNGTTTAGVASKAETVLENAGFTVRTIGNAKQQDYSTSFIYYQPGRQAEAIAVQQALKAYSTTLEESSLAAPDMVLIVIGQK